MAEKFGEEKILYDKFHEAEFARYDLGIYLPKLYREQADLIIAVICPSYDQKQWTGWEWMAIYPQLTKSAGHNIMLARFEYAQVDGLFDPAAFVELDHKTPEQAATLILERLALNEGRSKDYYTKPLPADPPVLKTDVPNNLPRLQSFFGRTEELQQIAEALEPEARTWGVLIDGPGGMGKTSLAVRAAYACTPAQFQRIIFLSVKDRELDDDGERQLGSFILPGFLEMLNELARELGQPDINKSPEDQRIRLLLDALRPVQALLILDNLESLTKADRGQLFTFVKRLPQGCKAILTSRRRIGSSADTLILEKFTEAAALEILADLARRNQLLAKTSEDERRALHQQTGGNPLLLRWVAGQLGRGSCRTLTQALHFLRSCPPDNNPLEFIFGDLAREFTKDETKVLCALSYFSLPAKVEHLAELEEVEKEAAEIALRTLTNRSLVIPDQEETAFVLMPMVADFLRRARPEAVAEIGNRLEKRVYALVVENGYQKHDRFLVLDAAWPVVSSALPLFVAGPNQRLQIVSDALYKFLEFTGRWDEWLSLCQQAEVKAAAAGDHGNAGWRAYHTGMVHYLRRQADAILPCAERAETYWKMAGTGIRERTLAIQLHGLGHQAKKDYDAAIVAYREELNLLRSVSSDSKDVIGALDSEDVIRALNDLAEAERLSGDLAAAEKDCYEAMRIARAVRNAEGIAITTSNLAVIVLQRKDWLKAESLAREALPLSEEVDKQGLIGRNCQCLAAALIQQKKLAEALPFARRAVRIFNLLGHPDREIARAILDQCES